MGLGDVVDELHDEDGLADTGAAEEANLASLAVRGEQVDDLDSGFENLDLGRLFHELGGLAVNRQVVLGYAGSGLVHRTADDVEDPPKRGLAHRHHDRLARVRHGHAPDETVGGVHGDRSHSGLTEMLGNLEHEVFLFVRDGRVLHRERVKDRRQLAGRKRDVDNGTDDLQNLADVLRRLFLLRHETQPPARTVTTRCGERASNTDRRACQPEPSSCVVNLSPLR